MPLFWFLAGVLTTLASLVVVSPWLRTMPRLGGLPAAPWQASVGAVVIVVVMLGSYRWFEHPDLGTQPAATAPTSTGPAPTNTSNVADNTGAFGTAAKVFGDATGASTMASGAPGSAAGSATKAGAGSMDSAIAALEARLAKGGGTPDDWELLAKSFEFLGRPADAAKARAKQLPSLSPDGKAPTQDAKAPSQDAKAPANPAVASGATVSGEVTLAAALSRKATAGDTLFIVAKSVDAPGVPVAVLRGSVGSWPLKFTLDDSQAMMPGRNLSSAGRVTIEARISQKGQPLPAAGDLQGSSGVINPADHQPLKITIDRVIS
jgi:hypothetical protein